MTRGLDVFSETENKFIQFTLGSKKNLKWVLRLKHDLYVCSDKSLTNLILSGEMGDNFSKVVSLALDCPSLL